MTYTATGKEVLRGRERVADATSEAYATAIAAALNATTVDRRVSSSVMPEVQSQIAYWPPENNCMVMEYDTFGSVPDPSQSPDTLRTLRGDEGRLDVYRGKHRLGYIDAEDALWLLGSDGYAHMVEADVDRGQIAALIARHGA